MYILLRPHGRRQSTMSVRRRASFDSDSEDGFFEGYSIGGDAPVDTKDQTCYICTEAVHRHTGEGLVRGCACHTTEGFGHVSCLAEQAKCRI